MHPERLDLAQRRSLQRIGDSRLVQAVAALVHAGVQRRHQVGLVPARGDPDVVVAERGRERVYGVVHPPTRWVKAHSPHHVRDQLPLAVHGEAPIDHRPVDAVGVVGQRRDHRHQLRLQLVEQPRDLGALHARLVVVEQHVVGALEALEAVHVAAGKLEVPLQVGDERFEVRVRARRDPRLLTERGGPRHLGCQLGRHAHRLLATPRSDGHQAGVVGIGVGPVERIPGRLEQRARLLGDEQVVPQPLERGPALGAGGPATRGHHRLLVPVEQLRDAAEIRQLRRPLAQPFDGRSH